MIISPSGIFCHELWLPSPSRMCIRRYFAGQPTQNKQLKIYCEIGRSREFVGFFLDKGAKLLCFVQNSRIRKQDKRILNPSELEKNLLYKNSSYNFFLHKILHHNHLHLTRNSKWFNKLHLKVRVLNFTWCVGVYNKNSNINKRLQ